MTRLHEVRLRVAMADVDAAATLYFATPYRLAGDLAVQTATRHVWVEGGAATPVPEWLRTALTHGGDALG